MGPVLATRTGISSQDTSANERNPAQAQIFEPRTHPTKNNKKTFGFVVIYSDVLWRQFQVPLDPQECRTGCWRPGAGVEGQGQVFKLKGGGANHGSLLYECLCV